MATPAIMDKEEIESLIEFYRAEEDLWNIYNPNYAKKESRLRALERVAKRMGNKYTAEFINKKIIKLRSYYARELAKVRKAQKSGDIDTYDLYKSHWRYFYQIDKFLRGQITPRGTMANTNSQFPGEESEEDGVELLENIKTEDSSISCSPNHTPVTTKKRKLSGSDDGVPESVAVAQHPNIRPVPVLLTSTSFSLSPRTSVTTKKTNPSEPNTVVPEVLAVTPQPVSRPIPAVSTTTCTYSQHDEDFVFARYLANEIRKVKDQSTRNYLKLSIQKQIFDAQKEEGLLKQQTNTSMSWVTEFN